MNNDVDFFCIDLNRLEEEVAAQTKHFRRHASVLAEKRESWERAKAARDVAKDDLKRAFAEVDLEVRKSPAVHGLEKPTEKSVENVVLTSMTYRKSQKRLYVFEERVIVAAREKDDAQTEVDTLDQKKTMLVKAVDLWLAGYFATPRTKGANRDEVRRMQERRAFKPSSMEGGEGRQ